MAKDDHAGNPMCITVKRFTTLATWEWDTGNREWVSSCHDYGLKLDARYRIAKGRIPLPGGENKSSPPIA